MDMLTTPRGTMSTPTTKLKLGVIAATTTTSKTIEMVAMAMRITISSSSSGGTTDSSSNGMNGTTCGRTGVYTLA